MSSLITSATHNIPWFLRTPAEAIIGEQCYKTLIFDFDILDGPCLKYSLSKGLGLGIVLGGSIVKIPQIIKIAQAHSAVGLSLPAYVLETLSYAISLAYAYRSSFPFSTYGENFFMTIQNVAITLQIIYYGARGSGAISTAGRDKQAAARQTKVLAMGAGMAVIGASLFSERILPAGALTFLQAACVPISLLSKAPQILSNHRLKSTGTLSAFAVFNALLGCLARVFTTATEVKDPVILWGFILAAVLNAVIVGQMVAYWNNAAGGASLGSTSTSASAGKGRAPAPLRRVAEKAAGDSLAEPGSPLSPVLSPDIRRRVSEAGGVEEKNVGVPPSPVGSVPAKRWARKAD